MEPRRYRRFATPLAAELIGAADLVVAWGSTLNMWTTRHGELISPSAVVAQVDNDPAAFGVNRPVDLAVAGEVTAVAEAVLGRLDAAATGDWRTPELARRIREHGRWRSVPCSDEGVPPRDDAPATIDPRTLSAALDDLLPPERTVAVDSGNFMGYPSMWLDVPDVAGFCFTQAFQSVGLGLASALGAAVARPDRRRLEPVRGWLAGPRTRPLVIDAKVSGARGSWWLEEAFRGH
ncbi:hypothetical protein O7634_22310 [Micromonospora sp. WMMD1120]|uniref:hypothetical protein n=1 Tax=Micromonospora sp. WMMD1120 TaxID=3016106 RepID=UPI0024169C26|nr:hypothetical protein [Micromonospora sp. WMMD1120]MDG4809490.1 hypothetical protein [Micromonospora sp. WMMD1120]